MPQTESKTEHVPFVVIGPHYWGKGSNVVAAKAAYKAAGGPPLSHGYLVLKFPPESTFTGVDDMGYYHWAWTEDHEVEGERPPAPEVTEFPAKGA